MLVDRERFELSTLGLRGPCTTAVLPIHCSPAWIRTKITPRSGTTDYKSDALPLSYRTKGSAVAAIFVYSFGPPLFAVRSAGLEPARPSGRSVLSGVWLPVSPRAHDWCPSSDSNRDAFAPDFESGVSTVPPEGHRNLKITWREPQVHIGADGGNRTPTLSQQILNLPWLPLHHIRIVVGANSRTRTCTAFRPLTSEASASTYSAILALYLVPRTGLEPARRSNILSECRVYRFTIWAL
jgi:hypothetical protein